MTDFPIRFTLSAGGKSHHSKARCVVVEASSLQAAVIKICKHYPGRNPIVLAVEIDGVWRRIERGTTFITHLGTGMAAEQFDAGTPIRNPAPIEIERPDWAKAGYVEFRERAITT